MNDVNFGISDSASTASANFAARPASQNWEMIPCGDAPQLAIWAWFKPPSWPQGVIVNIPDETYRGYPHRPQLTMRTVARWVGLEPACVWQWMQYGMPHDSQQGMSAEWDQPLPDPIAGADPNITLTVLFHAAPTMPYATAMPAAMPASTPMPATTAAAAPPTESGDDGDIFENIDSEWKAIQKTERDLALSRKKLSDIITRLNTLNRDLNHDEKMHSSTSDKAAWQDARRWLRDVSARVSRYLKDCDVGDATSAAKRQWMEQTHEQYIATRTYFDGIHQVHREFEGYRKLVQTLFVNMSTAYNSAVTDGERRAQTILAQIAAKVRRAK